MQGTPAIAVLTGCIIAFPLTSAAGARQEALDTVLDVEEIEVVVGWRAGVADPATLPVPVDIYGSEEIARLSSPWTSLPRHSSSAASPLDRFARLSVL